MATVIFRRGRLCRCCWRRISREKRKLSVIRIYTLHDPSSTTHTLCDYGTIKISTNCDEVQSCHCRFFSATRFSISAVNIHRMCTIKLGLWCRDLCVYVYNNGIDWTIQGLTAHVQLWQFLLGTTFSFYCKDWKSVKLEGRCRNPSKSRQRSLNGVKVHKVKILKDLKSY